MIKLYYHTQLRIPGPSYETFPLLEQLELTTSTLHQDFRLVDTVEDCDVGFIPMNVQFLFRKGKKQAVTAFTEQFARTGKKVLVFSGGDYGLSLNDDHLFTIRLGGFHTKLNDRTFIMPPFIEDPLTKLGVDFNALGKTEKPTIGFVGHSDGSFLKYLKERLSHLKRQWNRIAGNDPTDKQHFYPSSIRRSSYLKLLEESPWLNTSFVKRNKYRAGVKTDEEKKRTTQEFYQNMADNLYTFCLRGTGNFSTRFYETLAMGRIPILVDTDCRLPFSGLISWDEHRLVVPEAHVDQLPELIAEFHNARTEEDLIQIQRENRRIWEDYFQRDAYFAQVASIIEPKL